MRLDRFRFWLAGLSLPAWLARRRRLRPLALGLLLAAMLTAIVYFVSPAPYSSARDFTRNGQPPGYHHFRSAVVIGIVTAVPCALIFEWMMRRKQI